MGLRDHLRRRPPPLPWRRPRHELLLIALVAIATLTPLYPINAQDVARVCLTRSLVHGHLYNDECLGTGFAVDRSAYKGHYYSDKAPGMSALEIPGVELAQVPNVTEWPLSFRKLWVVRFLAGGLAFLAGLFLLGRLSEGLAPGYGGAAIVAYGLGTLVAPLAGANFEHVTAGTLGLAAFALAWSRRPLLAGLVAGAALLVAYDAAIILAVVGVYVLAQGGFAFLKYVYGILPGAALLWTYNWLAFGAPWHMSYTYKVGEAAEGQTTGFFGVHVPYLHAIRLVFASESGLLVISPVVFAAGYGLVLLARRHLAEGLVCGVVAFAFLFLNCGYIFPLGGVSPGRAVPGAGAAVPRPGPRAGLRATLLAHGRPGVGLGRRDDGGDAHLGERSARWDDLGMDRPPPGGRRFVEPRSRAGGEHRHLGGPRKAVGRGPRRALRPRRSDRRARGGEGPTSPAPLRRR